MQNPAYNNRNEAEERKDKKTGNGADWLSKGVDGVAYAEGLNVGKYANSGFEKSRREMEGSANFASKNTEQQNKKRRLSTLLFGLALPPLSAMLNETINCYRLQGRMINQL